MTDTNKQQTTQAGAVELEEASLEGATGGASDYLLTLDGVKGDSKATQAGIIAVQPAASVPVTYDLKTAKR